MKSTDILRFVATVVFGWTALAAPAAASFIDSFETSIDTDRWNVLADQSTEIKWNTGRFVQIYQNGNRYANLYAATGGDVLSVQADIRNFSDKGATWAPGVALYFDQENWVQIGLRAANQLQLNWSFGSGFYETVISQSWSSASWYTLKIEVDRENSQLLFYFGEQNGALSLVNEFTKPLPETFTDESFVILGKGTATTAYNTNPFLRNSHATAGSLGYSYFDNVIVTTAIPEPDSLFTVVGGALLLGGILAFRRR